MQASYEGPKTFAWIIPWFAYYLNQVNDTSDNNPSIAKGQPAIHNSTHRFGYLQHGDSGGKKSHM